MDDLRKFNPEGSLLRKHQLRMLEILEVIDGICRKYDIHYWLSSGTLLGAIRHGGFIPWDDDLDIEMLKPDYKRLMRILPKELPDWLFVQTACTDKNYVAPYAKIRDLNSSIKETKHKDQNYKFKGVYIDVFYIEAVPGCLVRMASRMHGWLYRLSYLKNDRLGLLFCLKRAFYLSLTKLVYPMFRLFSLGLSGKVLRQCLGAGFLGERVRDEIFPLKEVTFEGKRFFAPRDPDRYLTRLYGDYMRLPDLDKIEVHLE